MFTRASTLLGCLCALSLSHALCSERKDVTTAPPRTTQGFKKRSGKKKVEARPSGETRHNFSTSLSSDGSLASGHSRSSSDYPTPSSPLPAAYVVEPALSVLLPFLSRLLIIFTFFDAELNLEADGVSATQPSLHFLILLSMSGACVMSSGLFSLFRGPPTHCGYRETVGGDNAAQCPHPRHPHASSPFLRGIKVEYQ